MQQRVLRNKKKGGGGEGERTLGTGKGGGRVKKFPSFLHIIDDDEARKYLG